MANATEFQNEGPPRYYGSPLVVEKVPVNSLAPQVEQVEPPSFINKWFRFFSLRFFSFDHASKKSCSMYAVYALGLHLTPVRAVPDGLLPNCFVRQELQWCVWQVFSVGQRTM